MIFNNLNIKNTFISFFLILLTNLFFSQNILEIQEIKKNIFVYTTYNEVNGIIFPSNGLYLVLEKGIVIIDTPWNTNQFQSFLDSLENKHHKKSVLSISTHFHDDRTAGLDFFKAKGIQTYSSLKTQQYCKVKNEKQAMNTFINDTTFNISGYEIETFYPGEGHSPDNIVIYLKKDKILFGGCLIKSLENNSLGNVNDANLNEWSNSVQKVIDKYPEAKIVIPGHFSWGNKKLLKHTIKLLKK